MRNSQCLYHCCDIECIDNTLCDDFYPICDEIENDDIITNIEKRREEYREAWFEYINDFEDSFVDISC